MTVLSDLDRLARIYSEQSATIRDALERYAEAIWDSLPDYYDETMEPVVEELVAQSLAGQMTLGEITNAYLSECASTFGLDVPIAAVDYDAIEAGLRGVDPKTVYQRPANTVYTKLSEGVALDAAVRAGKLRLLNIIGTDMQMARVRQAHEVMKAWSSDGGVSGGDSGRGEYPQYYRRILTGRENCALCTIASTQRYKVDKVLPIHPGCDCDFGPLPPGDYDWVIDEETLEAAHEAVEAHGFSADRSGRGPDYRKIMIEVEHGEYGRIIKMRPRKISEIPSWEKRPDLKSFRSGSTFNSFVRKVADGAWKDGKFVGGHRHDLGNVGNKLLHTTFPPAWGTKEIADAVKATILHPDRELIRRGTGWRVLRKAHKGVVVQVEYSYKKKTDTPTINKAFPLSGTVDSQHVREYHFQDYTEMPYNIDDLDRKP